jgi:hypothetical protein
VAIPFMNTVAIRSCSSQNFFSCGVIFFLIYLNIS